MPLISSKYLKQAIKQELGLVFELEHKFDDKRKWRFDLACVDLKIAVELEGGVYSEGRHTRGKGYINDCTKYNRACVLGWKVLRYTHSGHKYADIINDIRLLMIKRSFAAAELGNSIDKLHENIDLQAKIENILIKIWFDDTLMF